MICIIPNFFQLPINYAISRSVFFVDVRFENKFERGFFRFFSFKKKKDLYIYGRKTQNYDCVKPDFIGRFTSGYVVPEKEYRAAKYRDMIESEETVKAPTERQIKTKLFKQLKENIPGMTVEKLSKAFGVSERTGQRWMSDERKSLEHSQTPESDEPTDYTNNLNGNDDVVEGEEAAEQ